METRFPTGEESFAVDEFTTAGLRKTLADLCANGVAGALQDVRWDGGFLSWRKPFDQPLVQEPGFFVALKEPQAIANDLAGGGVTSGFHEPRD